MAQDLNKRTEIFSINLLQYLKTLNKNAINLIIINQLARSGTSIGANVHEAKAASSRKDFINYYHHALKSANESIYWLKILNRQGTNNKNQNELMNELIELAKILASSIIKLKQK